MGSGTRRCSRTTTASISSTALLAGVVVLLVACSATQTDLAADLKTADAVLREGRSADAVKLARAGQERAGATNPVGWRFRLLEAEGRLFLREPKEAVALLQEQIPSGAPFDPLRPRHAYLNAYAQILSGQAAAGFAQLPDVAEQARAQGLLDVALDAVTLQAQSLLRQGKFDVADRLLLESLAHTNDEVAVQRAAILLNLGMSRLVRNRFDEALRYFEQVLEDKTLERTLVYRTALGNAGTCYARLGDLERAIALQRRSVEGHERAASGPYLQQSLGELGVTLLLNSNPAEGIPQLSRALDIATKNGYVADAAIWAGNLAIRYGDQGDWDRSEHFNNIAVELKEKAGSPRLTYNIYTRARIAAGRGHTKDAIAGFEEAIHHASDDPYAAWEAEAGLAQVYRRDGSMSDAIGHFERALGIIEQTRAELLTREYRLTFLSRLIQFHRDYVDALVEHGDVERALEVAESSRARVLAERQGGARNARVPARDFVKLAERTKSVLLSYWLAPSRSFVWVITGSGIRVVTLPARQEIEPLVRGYRDFVTVSLADPLATESSPGTRLTEALLKPVLDAIPSGSSVVIVPDDVLHSVAFDMLPLAAPTPHYWIEDVTVTLTPSLALAAGAQPARAHAQPSLLLVGDPTQVDQTLPPLTYAGSEISGIERAFSGQRHVIRGAAATPRAVAESQPERYSLIHFAAHATASVESPLESAILLSPDTAADGSAHEPPLRPATSQADVGAGHEPPVRPATARADVGAVREPPSSAQSPSPTYKLYARDVIGMPLVADVVTLSACRSAGGRAYGGEGLVGFAWAFLRAGARQVVAGLWDVDDQATATLMERFYARLAAGAAPATALRDAKLSLLKSGGNFRKPYYWAAFAVFSSSLEPS